MGDFQKVETDELLKLLFMESNLEHFMSNGATDSMFPAFSDYISSLSQNRDDTPAKIIARADLDKSFGYQLFSGKRNPSRDSVIKLAFGFEADYDLAQNLLKIARKSLLHPKVKRDVVIIFCLQHQYSVAETNLTLDRYNLPLLGEDTRYE